jgi:DNA repair protein RadD
MKVLRDYQKIAVAETWQALKANDEPVLLMASVGAGKSLMMADILLTMQKLGKSALCIVHSADLVENNSETFNEQGGKSSIYSAALGKKDTNESVIFGTPQSILNGIIKNGKISEIKFNLIIVDEAHSINYLVDNSSFMRILRHYKQRYPAMRLLGATGTDFRFRGCTIVGEKCLFRRRVGDITTNRLINDGYLIKPTFNIDEKYLIDFSKVKIKNNGLFDHKQLTEVINKNCRLTQLICMQIIHLMENQNRFGIFIFASTANHAREIVSYLPASQTALILGNTPQHERTDILSKARIGKIKYLVNIAIISVGVDVPAFDTIAYLRPTESLVLMVQTIGRVLRLSPSTGKSEALVLDFAGNIERHSHWDDPILLDAIKQTIDKDKPLVIDCPQCLTMNTEHARRCVGQFKEARCDYYFEFKECLNPECEAKNDIAARHCHACGQEIIDPNAKLSMERIKAVQIELKVLKAIYNITGPNRGFRLNCIYLCMDMNGSQQKIYESYSPFSDKSTNIFYGQFVRKHCNDSSKWYLHLNNRKKVELMLNDVKTPCSLFVAKENNKVKIKKKIFE